MRGACDWTLSLTGVMSTLLGLQKSPTHKRWGYLLLGFGDGKWRGKDGDDWGVRNKRDG